jgi:hypothetical protein
VARIFHVEAMTLMDSIADCQFGYLSNVDTNFRRGSAAMTMILLSDYYLLIAFDLRQLSILLNYYSYYYYYYYYYLLAFEFQVLMLKTSAVLSHSDDLNLLNFH